MKNTLLFVTVFISIIAFYSVNALIEAKNAARFHVDISNGTNVFVDQLEDYYFYVNDLITDHKRGDRLIRGNYPPLYYIESAVILNIIGRSWKLMNFIHNVFYLGILIVFIYLLGKRLGDARTGIFAAVLISLYPLVYSAFDKFIPDFPLLALVTLNIYLLLKSEYFLDTRWTVLSAFGFCYGMLVKEPYGAFIAGPLIWVSIMAVYTSLKEKSYIKLINLFLFGIIAYIALFLLSGYYADNFSWKVYGRLLEGQGNYKYLNQENLRYFIFGLSESLLSLPFAILLLASIFSFLKRADMKIKVVSLSWILVPYLILFIMPCWKQPRYLMPVLPIFALISAVGMSSIYPYKIGKIITALVILIGVGQYYVFKYDLIEYDGIKILGIRYFQTEGELRTSISYNKRISDSIERCSRSIVNVLNEHPLSSKHVGRLKMLFVSNEGDWRYGFQGILGPYLWFAHNIDVDMIRSYEIVDAFIKPDNINDNVDLVVYAVRSKYGDVPLTFQLIKDNWLRVRKNICPSPEYDTKINYDWVEVQVKWDKFINTFRDHGIVSSDSEFITYLYTRDVPETYDR